MPALAMLFPWISVPAPLTFFVRQKKSVTPRRKDAKMNENQIGTEVVDAAVKVHRELGRAIGLRQGRVLPGCLSCALGPDCVS